MDVSLPGFSGFLWHQPDGPSQVEKSEKQDYFTHNYLELTAIEDDSFAKRGDLV